MRFLKDRAYVRLFGMPLVAGLGLSAWVLLLGKDYVKESEARSQLHEGGVYIRTNMAGVTGDIIVFGSTRDVNNDGQTEGILTFLSNRTGNIEERIVEEDSTGIHLYRFKVEDGRIEYLTQ